MSSVLGGEAFGLQPKMSSQCLSHKSSNDCRPALYLYGLSSSRLWGSARLVCSACKQAAINRPTAGIAFTEQTHSTNALHLQPHMPAHRCGDSPVTNITEHVFGLCDPSQGCLRVCGTPDWPTARYSTASSEIGMQTAFNKWADKEFQSVVASALLLVADFALSKIAPASPTATQTPIFLQLTLKLFRPTFTQLHLRGLLP